MHTLTITSNIKRNSSQKITDRIKTFEDACEALGIDGDVLTGNLHDLLAEDSKAIIAHTKLLVITKALNEGWSPNWNNEDEYKYYPWFNMEKGFELVSVACNLSVSAVSSRLCFKNEELARYAVKQFLSIYKDYFII